MSHRSLPRLLPVLPVAALLLATAACGDDDSAGDDGSGDTAGGTALVAEGASLAWSAQLDQDWSPTHATSVGDTVVVSTSWEIDEGAAVTAYAPDGSVVWSESTYSGALLAPVGDDEVLVCEFDGSMVLSIEDGSVVSEGDADDERCPVADDEEGIPVPRNDEAYTVNGAELTVDAPDGEYAVTLEAAPSEIFGVDGAVLTFVDDTDTVQLYR